MRDVVELRLADVLELLAACLELFVDLDGLLGHLCVRVLRAADEQKIIALRHALVAVGIQPDTEQRGFAFRFFGRCHLIQAKGGVRFGQAADVISNLIQKLSKVCCQQFIFCHPSCDSPIV